MKSCVLIVLFTVSLQAFGFAVQDMPSSRKARPSRVGGNKEEGRPFGAPVKLDLSYNRCVRKGHPQYRETLFYEEFENMDACERARQRG